MATIEINGTGGILEGNLEDANVNVNLDSVLTLDGSADYLTATSADFRSSDTAGAVTGWIKTTDGNYETIFSACDTATDNYYIRIYMVSGQVYVREQRQHSNL